MRATWAEHGQSRCAKQSAIRVMAELAEMRHDPGSDVAGLAPAIHSICTQGTCSF